MVGNTFVRTILLVETKTKGLKGFLNLVSFFEQEAISLGANRLSIGGDAIYNQGFLNMQIATRLGYAVKQINDATMIFQKGF